MENEHPDVLKCEHCPQDEETTLFPSENELMRHIRGVHFQFGYVCRICGKENKDKTQFNNHNQRQHPNYFLSCMYCDEEESYADYRTFNLHYAAKHLEMKDFRCVKCAFETNQGSIFKVHMLKVHKLEVTLLEVETVRFAHLRMSNPEETKSSLKRSRPTWDDDAPLGSLNNKKSKSKKQSRDYPCPYCPHMAIDNAYLSSHLRSKHFSCKLCSFSTIDQNSFDAHMLGYHPDTLICPICSHRLNSEELLNQHLNAHYQSLTFCCSLCSFDSPSIDELNTHVLKVHLHEKNQELIENEERRAVARGTQEVLHCPECQYVSICIDELTKHVKSSHEKEGKYLQCDECDYTATNIYTLRTHKKSRHDDMGGDKAMHRCSMCDFTCSSLSLLIKHNNMIHKDEMKTHYCEHCQFKTKDKDQLLDHVKQHEEGKREFICNICDRFRSVGSVRNVKEHIQTEHLDDEDQNDLKCPADCGLEFSGVQNLIDHIGLHEQAEIEGQLRCQLCEYRCHTQFDLSNHVNSTHSGPEAIRDCNACDFKTKDMFEFRCHMQRHGTLINGEKLDLDEDKGNNVFRGKVVEMRCTLCPHVSNSRMDHNKHLEEQHGGKGAVQHCKKCSYSSAHWDNFRRHNEVHHNILLTGVSMFHKDRPRYYPKKGKPKGPPDAKSVLDTIMRKKGKVDVETKIKCQLCNFVSRNNFKQQQHLQDVHGGSGKVHECDRCDYRSQQRTNFKLHYERHHGIDLTERTPEEAKVGPGGIGSGSRSNVDESGK